MASDTAFALLYAASAIGAIGWGVFTSAQTASSKSKLRNRVLLAGLAIVVGALIAQNLLARQLYGDEQFTFLYIMALFLIVSWCLSLLAFAGNPSWEAAKVTIAYNCALIIPVMLSMAHVCSLP